MPTSTHKDEGYIKFSFAHEEAPAPEHPRLHELMRIRDDLHEWELIGVLPGDIGYGNISARIGETGRFLITASGTGLKFPVERGHFCEVLSFDIAQNRVICRGPLPASSESMSHGAIYAARPGARCVIHIHDAILFRMLLAEGAPRTPPEAAFGTPEMARAVGALAATLPPVGLIVMAGHEDGLLAFAPDPGAARDALWEAYSRSRRQ
ncbi:MAG: class II aldolase/adducin family protein [Lentisphaerae bacterium]|nr:class II aldolase/adducin family protein [Lentisphaerota bacterium]